MPEFAGGLSLARFHCAAIHQRKGAMAEPNPTSNSMTKGKKVCPVCGQPSYSREGIHPQCAIEQSDAPRQEELARLKKKAATEKKQPRQRSWNKKCPKCGTELHVRRKSCECGHAFEKK